MKNEKTKVRKGGSHPFIIEGKIEREEDKCNPRSMDLVAYAFNKGGTLLGTTQISDKGKYELALDIAQAEDIELVVGPPGDPEQLRKSSAFSQMLSADQWKQVGKGYVLSFSTLLPLNMWRLWFTERICVTGHIRKHIDEDGEHEICPVPYVKVEVFDVDREACFWPWLRRFPEELRDLLDKPVIRVPDLIKIPLPEPDPFPPGPLPEPFPGPFPGPKPEPRPRPDPVPFSDQPGAGNSFEDIAAENMARENLPQPQLSRNIQPLQLNIDPLKGLEKATLTSRLAPWIIFPGCFYTRQLVCTTTTDCQGYFRCCFDWQPFYFRRGRLRYDRRPDIIIKVTQIINGVERVIYMDPYSSTRWNVNYTHIDLFLDDEDIVCGDGRCYTPPEGSPVYIKRIGDDETFMINQTNGLYSDSQYHGVAYGASLLIHGQFGDELTRSDPLSGGPDDFYYYRLSYAKQGSADSEFKYIDTTLSDTRTSKQGLISDYHKLGPFTVNGEGSLYEVRNFRKYFWNKSELIGIWNTRNFEKDTDRYILRLELFDKNGNKLNTSSGKVDYRNYAGDGNGTVPPVLPAVTDHADLLITLDNKPPSAEIDVKGATTDCGIIKWTSTLQVKARIKVSHPNNRLRSWYFWYTKGSGVEQLVEFDRANPLALPAKDDDIDLSPIILPGLTGSCAFALRLRAYAMIRNGRHFIYLDQDIDAIAIEKCS